MGGGGLTHMSAADFRVVRVRGGFCPGVTALCSYIEACTATSRKSWKWNVTWLCVWYMYGEVVVRILEVTRLQVMHIGTLLQTYFVSKGPVKWIIWILYGASAKLVFLKPFRCLNNDQTETEVSQGDRENLNVPKILVYFHQHLYSRALK